MTSVYLLYFSGPYLYNNKDRPTTALPDKHLNFAVFSYGIHLFVKQVLQSSENLEKLVLLQLIR
jgi:hypothetical protein